MRGWVVGLAGMVALPAAAWAAPLWQGSESGMSRAEVAAAFPEARSPAKVDTIYSGARCELEIPTYKISERDFRVCFYFKADRLEQVTLGGINPSEPQFDTFVELLRSKYGPELGSGQPACKRGLLTTCKANWSLSSGSNIAVIYMTVGGKDPVLNINYQTRVANEASKL